MLVFFFFQGLPNLFSSMTGVYPSKISANMQNKSKCVFLLQNNSKDLDPSNKVDLDLWAELQIRGGIEDNSKIILLISQQKHIL